MSFEQLKANNEKLKEEIKKFKRIKFNLEIEVKELKEEVKEYEAVEMHHMEIFKGGGTYEDALPSHFREGKVVNGKWHDFGKEESDEEED